MIVRELLAVLGLDVEEEGFHKAEGRVHKLRMGFERLYALFEAKQLIIKHFAEGVADHAREIQNTARMTGMSVEAVQEMQYAAKTAGVESGEMAHGLVHLARAAQESAQGTGKAGAVFARLGIRATDITGKVRPMADLIADVAAKFGSMPDGTEKAAMSMELFGRAGFRILPLLNQGPGKLAALAKEFKGLGGEMSDRSIKTALAYRRVLDRMEVTFDGLKQQLVLGLMPTLARASEHFGHFIRENRKGIIEGLVTAFEMAEHIVKSVEHGLMALAQAGSGAKLMLLGLGLIVSTMIAPWMTLAGVIALVVDDFVTFLRGGDSVTGRIVKALSGVTARLKKAWDEGHFFETLFAELKAGFGTVFDWVVEQGERIGDKLAKAIARGLGKALGFGDAPGATTGHQQVAGAVPDSFMRGLSNWLGNVLDVHAVGALNVPVGGGTVLAPSTSINITVNSAPGADGAQIGQQLGPVIRREWEGFVDSWMRSSYAALAPSAP